MSRFFTTTLIPPTGATIGDAVGQLFYKGTLTPVDVYEDSGCTQLIASPFSVASNPVEFWVVDGLVDYDLLIGGGNLVKSTTIPDKIGRAHV